MHKTNQKAKYYIVVSLLLIVLFSACSQSSKSEIDLSGTWAFKIDRNDQGIQDKWFKQMLTDTIKLPGSMTENGIGDPVGYNTQWTGNFWRTFEDGKQWFESDVYQPYLNDEKFRFPFWLIADKYYTGAAWYQKEVTVSDDWQGQKIELLLERCHWETRLWVNGNYCGMQNSLGTQHLYDISDNIKPGKNLISICVDNRVKDINPGIDAHSISDNTQSNWNGIVGEIKLMKKPPVSISNIQVFPDIENRIAEINLQVEDIVAQNREVEITVKAKSSDGSQSLKPKTIKVQLDGRYTETKVQYQMGNDVLLWDEFNPNLYNLTVTLTSAAGINEEETIFGMRDFKAENKGFKINNRPVFLRGTLECAIFPKTGYPPTDVESWKRIINICKAHGLNHIRFHSWCPPKAAFVAADELGFYYQVESSAWANIGDGKPIDQWLYQESNQIVKEYGNHPSFCLMPYGNEPHGKNHKAYLTDFVKYWKEKDDRRVYTTGAGWPIIPENDFHNTHRGTRIQGWNQNLNSVINAEAPRSDYDFEKSVAELTAPMISHEIGQWCVYPNFKEMEKYDGVLKATNFEIFQKSLEAHGMLHLADSFLLASGKLQALCYKADIEAALRTPGFGGFQLLDLHDFPGQGTALVGVLDPFWDEKGYISPEEFSRFCNETVPLARFKKRIFMSDENIEASVEVAHYGEKELTAITPTWKIIDDQKNVVKEGRFNQLNLMLGHNIQLGAISENIEITKASKFQLQVNVAGFENDWDFWVYPAKLPKVESDVLVVSNLNEKAISTLSNGGKVLLTVKKGSIKKGKGGEVGIGFSSIFWNTAWTNGQKPHTLGILCNPQHPALADFPTEYHSNWQWWDAMSHSNAINVEGFDAEIQPIVRVIDDWVTNRQLALLFEAKVGKGKLLISGIDLISDAENRPEARQLLFSVKNYMNSNKFNPASKLSTTEIQGLFK